MISKLIDSIKKLWRQSKYLVFKIASITFFVSAPIAISLGFINTGDVYDQWIQAFGIIATISGATIGAIGVNSFFKNNVEQAKETAIEKEEETKKTKHDKKLDKQKAKLAKLEQKKLKKGIKPVGLTIRGTTPSPINIHKTHNPENKTGLHLR